MSPEKVPVFRKVHLFRGAPPVRSWSKYQQTVKGWSHCLILMRPSAKSAAKGDE